MAKLMFLRMRLRRRNLIHCVIMQYSIVYEVEAKLKDETYEEAFLWAKGKIEQYPNCEQFSCSFSRGNKEKY